MEHPQFVHLSMPDALGSIPGRKTAIAYLGHNYFLCLSYRQLCFIKEQHMSTSVFEVTVLLN
jgi:hypothetical protein